jgi:hypothetical protein
MSTLFYSTDGWCSGAAVGGGARRWRGRSASVLDDLGSLRPDLGHGLAAATAAEASKQADSRRAGVGFAPACAGGLAGLLVEIAVFGVSGEIRTRCPGFSQSRTSALAIMKG